MALKDGQKNQTTGLPNRERVVQDLEAVFQSPGAINTLPFLPTTV